MKDITNAILVLQTRVRMLEVKLVHAEDAIQMLIQTLKDETAKNTKDKNEND